MIPICDIERPLRQWANSQFPFLNSRFLGRSDFESQARDGCAPARSNSPMSPRPSRPARRQSPGHLAVDAERNLTFFSHFPNVAQS